MKTRIMPLTPYLFGGVLVFVLLSVSIKLSWIGNTHAGAMLTSISLAALALLIGLYMLLWDGIAASDHKRIAAA